mgnify:CR=1 FL=1
MKTAHQIAMECGLGWQQVSNLIVKEEIIPAQLIGKKKYYNKYQEDYIHNILYFTCMIKEITYESKSNYKLLKDLAKELNIEPRVIQRTVLKLGLKVKRINDRRIILLDKKQEDEVINILFIERKISEMTFESKMNIKETFEEFKQRTYTRL